MTLQGPLSGQVLGGKYLLGELLGKGSLGTVYKAEHQTLGRPQAIKVLAEEHFSDAASREQFLRRARTLAALDHANIVPIDELGTENQLVYLVMPYLSGGTLQDVLKAHAGPLSLEASGRVLEHICAALGYAHAQGVVHLALTPGNVLIHQDGRLLLADCGLTQMLTQGAGESGPGRQSGSPLYMAQEQFAGRPGPRSDLYALGIILYQMLAGRLPFDAATPPALRPDTLPPLRQARPDVPASLDGLLAKALAKQPEQRYQSAAELLVAFKMALAGPAVAQPSGAFAPASGPVPFPAHVYSDPTMKQSAPLAGAAGPGSGPLLPPRPPSMPPGQPFAGHAAMPPGGPLAPSPGYVLVPRPAPRPVAKRAGQIWTPGFLGAFLGAAIGGFILTIVGIVGVGESNFVITTTLSDVAILLLQLGTIAVAVLGIVFMRSWLLRSGFIALAAAMVVSVLDSIVTLYEDVARPSSFHPPFGNLLFTLTSFYLPFFEVVLMMAGLLCLSYGLGRWQKLPDAWLITLQIVASVLLAWFLTSRIDVRLFSDLFLGFRFGGNVFLFALVLACALFGALTLLTRPATWKRYPIVVACLGVGALAFVFHVPYGYEGYDALFGPFAGLTLRLSFLLFLRIFYILFLLPYTPFLLGLLLLVQTLRARKQVQLAQPAPVPAPAPPEQPAS